MAMSSETKRRLQTLGISHMNLEPGGFYQGVLPGGFSDVVTQITIPGPKVEFENEFTREIKAFKEVPEPIQIPHYKVHLEKNENSGNWENKEYDFNATGQKQIHEGLMYALQTGVIRYVSDDEMEEKYPETWAKRSPKLVWHAKSDKPEKSMRQLLDEAEQSDSYARNAHAHAVSAHVKATQVALLEGKAPPPRPASK